MNVLLLIKSAKAVYLKTWVYGSLKYNNFLVPRINWIYWAIPFGDNIINERFLKLLVFYAVWWKIQSDAIHTSGDPWFRVWECSRCVLSVMITQLTTMIHWLSRRRVAFLTLWHLHSFRYQHVKRRQMENILQSTFEWQYRPTRSESLDNVYKLFIRAFLVHPVLQWWYPGYNHTV